MDMIVSILIFFIIFGVLVISHEGGHFLIARLNGIRVKEFTVGVGPQLLHKVKNGTTYSVRALPFGGACIFDGMPGLDDDEDDEEEDEEPYENTASAWNRMETDAEEAKRAVMEEARGVPFREAKVWGRIATVFAGPLFNFILAYLIALVVTTFSVWDYPVVAGFTDNSAAKVAGIQEGDVIVSMDGDAIHMADEARLISQFNNGSTIHMIVERDGETMAINIEPNYSEEDARYYMGIYIGEIGRVTGAKILPYAWYTVKYYLTATYRSLGLLFTGRLGMDALSGPVGMVQMVDETYEVASAYGLPTVALSMLELTLLLSVNLGVMNLLPIPALDGGRLVFLLIEVVRGKPIPPEKEGYVHLAGIVALIALMAFVLFKDVTRLVG